MSITLDGVGMVVCGYRNREVLLTHFTKNISDSVTKCLNHVAFRDVDELTLIIHTMNSYKLLKTNIRYTINEVDNSLTLKPKMNGKELFELNFTSPPRFRHNESTDLILTNTMFANIQPDVLHSIFNYLKEPVYTNTLSFTYNILSTKSPYDIHTLAQVEKIQLISRKKTTPKSLAKLFLNFTLKTQIQLIHATRHHKTADFAYHVLRRLDIYKILKQDDDLLHNYTVAKATQPYNFASASNDADLGYKSVLIACTYHCG